MSTTLQPPSGLCPSASGFAAVEIAPYAPGAAHRSSRSAPVVAPTKPQHQPEYEQPRRSRSPRVYAVMCSVYSDHHENGTAAQTDE